jgi:uncharacterized protein (TIGR02757 family)
MNNQEIIELSKKYEDRKYFEKDPVSFLWKYKDKRDIEVAAVICSVLAFGNRQQIYKACEKTLALMGDSPYKYIMEKLNYEFSDDVHCWYRMLKMYHFYDLCRRLRYAYKQHEDLESAIKWGMDELNYDYIESIIDLFKDINGIPKDTKSCCKRLNLMLRWLVRQNSPIDVGIWKSLDQSKLLLPLDVHSLNTLREIGAIKRKSNDMKTVMEATEWAKEIYPNDPVSLDFYLFGKSYEEAHPEEFEESEEVPMKPNQILLVSVYQVMALNEMCNCCVLDIEPSIKNKDKETKKLFYAAKKRVNWYQKEVNNLTISSGTVYADFNDNLDVYIQPLLFKYRQALEDYLSTIKGVENPYFASLVEVARSMTKLSITEISNRIKECIKFAEDSIALRHYKQKELLDIINNLVKWVFRKAEDINYNDSPECVEAYKNLVDAYQNPNIIGECIIKAQQINDKEDESKI